MFSRLYKEPKISNKVIGVFRSGMLSRICHLSILLQWRLSSNDRLSLINFSDDRNPRASFANLTEVLLRNCVSERA